MSDDNDSQSSAAGFAGGQAGAAASVSEAAGTEAMREGMEALRKAAQNAGERGVEQAKGNLFEYIETAKLNEELARDGSVFRAIVTAAKDQPHAPSDIDIYNQMTGEVVEEAQAKIGGVSYVANVRDGLSNEKYAGMQRVTASDVAPDVRETLRARLKNAGIYSENYEDTLENLESELRFRDSSSGGTPIDEAREAAEEPNRYAAKMEGKAVGRQAGKAGATGALVGGAVGAGVAVFKNGIGVYNGELTKEEAVKLTAKETGKSAARGGAAGAGGSVLSHAAAKSAGQVGNTGIACGLQTVSKSNVATAIASALVDVGCATYQFGTGNMSAEQYVQRLGRTGTATMSSMYVGASMGAAAGAIAGPPGAVVGSLTGSIVGYMTATLTYESVIGVFQEAEQAQEEAERFARIACDAIQQMEAQRREFEEVLDEALKEKGQEIDRCFDIVEAITLENDHAATVGAICELAGVFGKTLKFERFQDFDTFMLDPESGPLVI